MVCSKSEKSKPMFIHALIQGILALVISVFLASENSWHLVARATSEALNALGVRTDCVTPVSIEVRLMDGTLAVFQILIECSGIITVAVFSFISTFTVGLLRGSFLKKIFWFFLSVGVGFLWNINRLVLVLIIAYNFGLSAFSFSHYLLGPFIDFIWVVSMWSLGMSWLRGEGNLT